MTFWHFELLKEVDRETSQINFEIEQMELFNEIERKVPKLEVYLKEVEAHRKFEREREIYIEEKRKEMILNEQNLNDTDSTNNKLPDLLQNADNHEHFEIMPGVQILIPTKIDKLEKFDQHIDIDLLKKIQHMKEDMKEGGHDVRGIKYINYYFFPVLGPIVLVEKVIKRLQC